MLHYELSYNESIYKVISCAIIMHLILLLRKKKKKKPKFHYLDALN